MENNFNVVTFTIAGALLDSAVCRNHDLAACIASHVGGLRAAGYVGEGTAKVLRNFASEAEANFIAFGDPRGYQGGNASDEARRARRACGRCGGQGMAQYAHIAAGCCFECGTPPGGGMAVWN